MRSAFVLHPFVSSCVLCSVFFVLCFTVAGTTPLFAAPGRIEVRRASGYNRQVTRTYVQVILVEIVVVAALWALGRAFA
jgi:hypothetical protein